MPTDKKNTAIYLIKSSSAHCAKEKKKAMAKQAISYFRGDNVA